MKRTQEEINGAIKVLTSLLQVMPATSIFGDDNHGAINAQIGVLRGTITNFDSYPNWDLLEAISEWMNGGSEEWLNDAKCDLKNFTV